MLHIRCIVLCVVMFALYSCTSWIDTTLQYAEQHATSVTDVVRITYFDVDSNNNAWRYHNVLFHRIRALTYTRDQKRLYATNNADAMRALVRAKHENKNAPLRHVIVDAHGERAHICFFPHAQTRIPLPCHPIETVIASYRNPRDPIVADGGTISFVSCRVAYKKGSIHNEVFKKLANKYNVTIVVSDVRQTLLTDMTAPQTYAPTVRMQPRALGHATRIS